jgi:hypothetical protein
MRTPLRNRHFLTFLAFSLSTIAGAQSVGISTNAAVPNANAILDIDASALGTKRGLLIPRMTAAQRLAIPVTAADNGLLVYQLDTGTVNVPQNQRGFWYYDAAVPAWLHLSNVKRGWSTTGNIVSTVTGGFAEYLGTYTNAPNRNLVFRTVMAPANPAMQMGYNLMDYKSGFVGLGTPAPAVERLEVNGGIRFAKNATPAAHITTPNEGTIRYGTIDGLASSATNLNWHWGTLDTTGSLYWGRLENAENFVTPPKPYAKDTLLCVGATGDAFRGHLSTPPVTQTTATPANVYSPFATNFLSTARGDYRVQYMYRNSELEAAGICFPATITAIAFFCLDQENMANPGSPIYPTTIDGEIRARAPGDPAIVGQGNTPYYGSNNTTPYMDGVTQASAPVCTFSAFTPGPGWVNFTLSPPVVLAAGQHLIVDINWSRNLAVGVGPKVELEDPGFNCTKWVVKPSTAGTPASRAVLDDFPIANGTITPVNINPHQRRPVTRFTANIKTAAQVPSAANYVQYDGGVMIGSPAWVSGTTFRGPGTVKAQNGIYDAGVLLSDHVFDRYFDGQVKPQDAHAAQGYAYVGLDQLRKRLEKDRHLPNMPSRQEWEAKGGASLGTLATGLWETVENQALYITQLEKDLSSLEELSFGKSLTTEEAGRLIAEIQGSKRLSEAQKLHLVDAVHAKAANAKP